MGNLKGLQLQVPSAARLAEGEDTVADPFGLLRASSAESRALAELRDTLPEVLSGRLRAPVAEELVEQAT